MATPTGASPPGARVESLWSPAPRRPSVGDMASSPALVRPRQRVLAGVCAGLGRRFGMSPTLVRILFLLSMLLPGPQILAYLVLWVIMPSE